VRFAVGDKAHPFVSQSAEVRKPGSVGVTEISAALFIIIIIIYYYWWGETVNLLVLRPLPAYCISPR
jgi:hypothetical protein